MLSLPRIRIRRFALALIVVCGLLTGRVGWATAQDGSNAPLLMAVQPANANYFQADIWAWRPGDPAFTQRTTWGYNTPMVVSPNGQWMAYLSVPGFAVEAIAAGRFPRGLGEITPYNIWLLSVDTEDSLRIAPHPADAVLADPALADNVITRSMPAWSPDGTEIAWVEYGVGANNPGGDYRLVAYNLASGVRRVVVASLPRPQGYEGIILPRVKWGVSGFAVDIVSVKADASGLSATFVLYIYRPDGFVSAFSPELPIPQPFIYDWAFVDGREVVILPVTRQSIDPLTGATNSLNGTPQLYSASAFQGVYLTLAVENGATRWKLFNPPNNMLFDLAFASDRESGVERQVAISPDGLNAAYLDDIGVLRGIGQFGPINFSAEGLGTPQGIAWSHLVWRMVR